MINVQIKEGSIWRRGFYERQLVLSCDKQFVHTRELDTQVPLHFRYSKKEFLTSFWIDDGESHCDCRTCKEIQKELKRPIWRLVGRV